MHTKIESELSEIYLADRSLTARASSLFSGGLFIYGFVAAIYGVNRVNLSAFIVSYCFIGALGLMGLTLWCLGNLWHDKVRPRLLRRPVRTGPVNAIVPAGIDSAA